MSRTLTSLLAVSWLGFAGCDVGGGTADDDDQMPSDANDQAMLCAATVTLSGTFTASAPLDPLGGCQPQGTWAVSVTVANRGTCTTVPVKTSYSYTLSGTGRNTKITYAKASNEEFQGNVSAGGSGQCSGFFEHILPSSDSFALIALRPVLPEPDQPVTTLAITGGGDVELWTRHP
jgi:hypothetical protein